MISAVMPADHFFNCSGHAQFEIMSTLHRFSFLGHGRLVRQGVHVHIFWFQILYFATSSTRSKELVMNPCRYAQYFSQKFSRALSRFENCRSKNDLAISNCLLPQRTIQIRQTCFFSTTSQAPVKFSNSTAFSVLFGDLQYVSISSIVNKSSIRRNVTKTCGNTN